MKTKLLLATLLLTSYIGFSQCATSASGFGNNSAVPSYNVAGDVTVTLNTDNTVTLDLGANFMTASGPDIRAYLVNSNGASDAVLASSLISNLDNIMFGLVGSNTVNQNGAKSFTVAIPPGKNIENFDKVFFYCLNFNQFWDFGTYTSFNGSNCAVLGVEDRNLVSKVTISPNPASDNIRLSNIDTDSGEIRIFNVLGKEVYQQRKNLDQAINVSHLNAGVYILKIEVEGQVKTQKLVIQ